MDAIELDAVVFCYMELDGWTYLGNGKWDEPPHIKKAQAEHPPKGKKRRGR